MSEQIKTEDLAQAMAARYNDRRRYSYAFEVGRRTGGGRHIDMVVVHAYNSEGNRIDGFEFKVSRSDLRNEFRNNEKHACFYDELDTFTLVCPKGVEDMELIPKRWGVLNAERKDDGIAFSWRRKPLDLHDERVTVVDKDFCASVCRAMQTYAPSDDVLRQVRDEAWKNGAEHARSADMMKYQRDKLARADVLFEAMRKRGLYAWDDESIEKVLDDAERYRKLDFDNLGFHLRQIAKSADRSLAALEAM